MTGGGSIEDALTSLSARAVVRQTLHPDDRVIVLGAGGWFGRTALDLILRTGVPVLPVASSSRVLSVAGVDVTTVEWDEETVARFAPTVVIDCAFLTRDRVADLSLEDYVATNTELTRRFLHCVRSPGMRRALTISSGAAVHPTDAALGDLDANPYGYLKRQAESLLDRTASAAGVEWSIARAWSVSGAYVRYPRHYALADLILQAASGSIAVRADHPVWRRYVLADELLAVSLAAATAGGLTVDSGGPLVEMSTLATAIRDVIAPDARISRPVVSGHADDYHSDDSSWREASEHAGLITSSLAEQIAVTARGLGVEATGDIGTRPRRR